MVLRVCGAAARKVPTPINRACLPIAPQCGIARLVKGASAMPVPLFSTASIHRPLFVYFLISRDDMQYPLCYPSIRPSTTTITTNMMTRESSLAHIAPASAARQRVAGWLPAICNASWAWVWLGPKARYVNCNNTATGAPSKIRSDPPRKQTHRKRYRMDAQEP